MERKNRRLWVAFTGKTDIWYLKFLNKEFRHCFIILDDVNHWITIDPLSSSTEIEVINKKDYSQDLPSWFQEIGFKLVETKFYIPSAKSLPLRLLNCVEIAKNIIGIQNFFILTPYQLFKFLNQNKRKEIEHGKFI